MDATVVGSLLGALLFLGVGLGLGWLLWRKAAFSLGRSAAEAELAALREQLKAKDQQLAEQRHAEFAQKEAAEKAQERVVALSADLARASANAEAATGLQADLDASAAELKALGERLTRAEAARAALEEKVAAVTARDEEARRTLTVLEAEAQSLTAELSALDRERTKLSSELESERRAAQERAREADQAKEMLRLELNTLAGKIADEKGKAMLEQSQQSMEVLLAPVKERLKEFEQKVEKAYEQETRERASLKTELELMLKAQEGLKQEAQNLTRALTVESKTQGNWGEVVLERLLESAGLAEGREFETQASHTDDEGARLVPDVVLNLPGERAIVIDSKVSLKAWVAATGAESGEARDAALEAHAKSVSEHVKSLGAKRYQDLLHGRALDVVLMFVPSEGAFHAAMSSTPRLFEDAFQKNVVVVSPTTLLAALQVVRQVWRSERQAQNAQAIAEEAGKLHKKLSAFVTDLELVGERLGKAQDAFDSAKKRLATGRGNVLKTAQKLEELGARVDARDQKQLRLLSGGVDEDEDDEAPATDPQGSLLEGP